MKKIKLKNIEIIKDEIVRFYYEEDEVKKKMAVARNNHNEFCVMIEEKNKDKKEEIEKTAKELIKQWNILTRLWNDEVNKKIKEGKYNIIIIEKGGNI